MAERELQGSVAVVTGASRGIGEALAEALAQTGCRLVLAARNQERLDAVASRLREAYKSEAITVQVDIGQEQQARRLVRRALEHFGRVDILINNAGIGIYGAIDELNLDDLRRVFDVNFYGPLAAIQEAVPAMRSQGGGVIVNVGSIVGAFPQPLSGGYVATKFALHGATGAARAELRRDKIDVVLLCPGLTETEFSQHSRVNIPGAEHTTGQKHALTRGVDPRRVASRAVEAIRRGEREVYITWWDWLLVRFATLFPGLFHWVLVYVAEYRRRQFSKKAASPPPEPNAAAEPPPADGFALPWQAILPLAVGLAILWRRGRH